MNLCEQLSMAMNEKIVQIKKDLPMKDISKATKKGEQPTIFLNGSDGYFYASDGILRQIRSKGEIKEFGFKRGHKEMAKAEKDFVDLKLTMSKYYEIASKLENDSI